MIDRLISLRGKKEMAGSIAVKRTKHALPLNHLAQRCHYCAGRYLLYQLGVIDLAGGVIHDHQQVVPAIVTEPAMLTGINVQEHPGQGPPRSPLTIFAALALRLYQSRSLQSLLHPGVTQLNLVFTLQLLVKVTHVEVKVLFLVEPQYFFYRSQRHSLR